MQLTKDFKVSLHGDKAVKQLASCWCYRMQRMYDIFRAAEDHFHLFTEAEVASCDVTAEMIERCRASALEGQENVVLGLLAEVRDIKPRAL